MASINIREIDRSQYDVITNISDNIVYVPGSAITGPSNTAILCRSYTEFIEAFGTHAPVDSVGSQFCSSWEYAINLLIEGFPVLFRRITEYTTDVGGTPTTTVISATSKVSLITTSGGVDTEELRISGYYAGTEYNGVKVTFSTGDWVSGTTAGQATVKIVKGDTTENLLIADLLATDTQTEVTAKVKANIDSLNSSIVKFEVIDTSAFALPTDWTTTEYTLAGGTDATEAQVKDALVANASTIYEELKDTDLFDVKFLTLGGKYATADTDANMYTALENIATDRKDCIFVADIPLGTSETDAPTYFTDHITITSSYSVAYAPWCYFGLRFGGQKWVAPSFVFLFELAKSISIGNPIWMPMAGINRGSVPEAITTEYDIGKLTTDKWQNVTNTQFLNPIRRVKDYGYTIWGQKTLYTTASALRDLNVRITANEIKRKIRDVALSLTFEENNIATWNAFRGEMDTYLSQLLAEGALYNYRVIIDESTTSEDDIDNNIMRGAVIVRVTRAAEEFDIDFYVANNTATFDEIVNSYS